MGDNSKIIDKVLNDERFRSELVNNPEMVLRSMGVDATPEVVAALRGLDAQGLHRLVTAFGKQQAAF